MRSSLSLLLVVLCCLSLTTFLKADTLSMTGNLSSDSTAVSPSDPTITNANNIVIGSAIAMTLTYDPSAFSQTGSIYQLTNASFDLSFDGYAFDYSSATGSYIAVSFPGAFGAGTVSFQICTSFSDCTATPGDFINLYYSGTVTSLAALASQASGLSGDVSSSPSEFEFLSNFSDGSQTDLQGTLKSPTGSTSTVPEPSTIVLLVTGGVALLSRRHNTFR